VNQAWGQQRCIALAFWPISHGFVYIWRLGPRGKHLFGLGVYHSATALVRNKREGMGLYGEKRLRWCVVCAPLFILAVELELILASKDMSLVTVLYLLSSPIFYCSVSPFPIVSSPDVL
jgi:hypothetical protein